MNKFYLTGALLASALAVTACNKGATTNNAAAPAANTTNAATPAAPAGNGSVGNTAGGQAQQNFTVVNNTGHTVVHLMVSPNNENSWGPDILGRDTLANGETASITFPRNTSQCAWDIQAVYDRSTLIHAAIETTHELKSVYSPTHSVNVERPDNKHAVVKLEVKDSIPTTDFRLLFDTADGKLGASGRKEAIVTADRLGLMEAVGV